MKPPEFNAAEAELFIAARLGATLGALQMVTPYMTLDDGNMKVEHIVIHAVQTAKERGSLGFLWRALGY